jgi:hypothetical protein
LIDKLPSKTYALPVIGSWLIDKSYDRGVRRAQQLLDSLDRRREGRTT